MRVRSCLWFASFVVLAAACHSEAESGGDLGADLSAGSGADLAQPAPLDGGTDDSGTLEPDAGGVVPMDAGSIDHVACGMTPCDVTTNVCCQAFMGGMVTSTCEPKAMCTMGVSRACDGTEDCTAGQVCCVAALGATSCAASCPFFEPEACHSKTDCPAAMMGQKVACCPLSQTLNVCRTFFGMQMIPNNCN
jgi:hypothetical protein